MTNPQNILDFWFKEAGSDKWYVKDDQFDQEIWDRFSTTIHAAKAGELWLWRKDIKGRLAEIIVLDQFSRNVFRNDPRSFSSDDMALTLAQEAIHHPEYEGLIAEEKQFILMPLMHSESLLIHEQLAEPLFRETKGLGNSYHIEILHKKQIEQFGRYPFRNEALGRKSTDAEITFMAENKGF